MINFKEFEIQLWKSDIHDTYLAFLKGGLTPYISMINTLGVKSKRGFNYAVWNWKYIDETTEY